MKIEFTKEEKQKKKMLIVSLIFALFCTIVYLSIPIILIIILLKII